MTDEQTRCIFCSAPTHCEPPEHIVPEGLIGEQPFEVTRGSIVVSGHRKLILESDEVCGRCNGVLGKLDAYVIHQCGFLRTVWNRVGTKSRRAATAIRPGMYAERLSDGPHVFFNVGRRPVTTPQGIKISPADRQDLAVRVQKFNVTGRIATAVVEQPMWLNKRFIRGLHKIAFELLCLQKGPSTVLAPDFDALRDYILRGRGSRLIVFTIVIPADRWGIVSFSLERDHSWPGWLATVALGTTFYVDLSPTNELFTHVDVGYLHQNGMVLWSDAAGGRPAHAMPSDTGIQPPR